jgi:hypothetical protein
VSEIYGTGYGSAHDWKLQRSAWGKPLDYRCRRCGAAFRFDPALGHINVWRVIEKAGIAEQCLPRAA